MRFPSSFFHSAAASLNAIRASRKKIIDIPYNWNLTAGLPSEICCAAAVLAFYRYAAPFEQVSARFPKAELRTISGGLYGKSPSEYLVRLPGDGGELGCCPSVVAATMNTFFVKEGWRKAADYTGSDFAKLLNCVSRGDPVILWATRGMKPAGGEISWTVERTGCTVSWVQQEHCFLLVGFDADGYYLSDPDLPDGLVRYGKELVECRYEEVGRHAVAAPV